MITLHSKKEIGMIGERLAARYLRRNGYRILSRNLHIGRNELDLVAKNKHYLAFVEVKTRNSDQYGYPSESVTAAKQLRIKKAAEQYLQGRRMQWNKLSFDVYEIMTDLIENCM